MKFNTDLTKDSISKLFFRYLFPSIGAMLSISFVILFDTMFVGKGIGSEGLASLNIAIPIFNVLSATGLLIGIGGSTALSISIGQGNKEEANSIFTSAVVIVGFISLTIAIFGSIFINKLCYILGANHKLFPLVKEYLRVLFLFAPFFIFSNALNVFARNDHAPKLAMCAMLTSSFTNIFLDALFIFVFKWGMFGAAFATCLGQTLSFSLLFWYFAKKSKLKLTLKNHLLTFNRAIRIIKNGFPTFIMELSTGLVIIFINKTLVVTGGTLTVAAYSIIANVALVILAIFNGIAQAIQPIISVNYGANKLLRIRKVIILALLSTSVISIFSFAFGMLFPKQITAFFNSNDPELMKITVNGIYHYFITFLFAGFNIVTVSLLQATEISKTSTVISLLRGIIFILILLPILSKLFNVNGVWITVPTAECLTLLISITSLFILNRSMMKNHKTTVTL